jgi:hypothetical protein
VISVKGAQCQHEHATQQEQAYTSQSEQQSSVPWPGNAILPRSRRTLHPKALQSNFQRFEDSMHAAPAV